MCRPNSGVQPTTAPTTMAAATRAGDGVLVHDRVPQLAELRRASNELHEARDDRLRPDLGKVDGELEIVAGAGEAAHLALAELGMAHALPEAEGALDVVVAGGVGFVLDGDAAVALDGSRERRLLVAAAIHPLRPWLRLADRPRDAVIGNVGEKAALDERPRVLPEQAPPARVGQEQPLARRA